MTRKLHTVQVTERDLAKLMVERDEWRALQQQTAVTVQRSIERLAEQDAAIAELNTECDQWQKKVAELWAEAARLRAALQLGRGMIDSLDDEGEFDTRAVHAFATALTIIRRQEEAHAKTD